VVIKPVEAAASPVRAKDLIGSKVLISGGTSVGVIEDIVFTPEGVVDYLVVSGSGKLVTVPWAVARVDYGKRVVTVPVTREDLASGRAGAARYGLSVHAAALDLGTAGLVAAGARCPNAGIR
jgi:hypothetical protein